MTIPHHDRTGTTALIPLPCPDCGNRQIVAILLVTESGKHQHTWYVCTHWPHQQARCGWTGYSVPGWRDQPEPDEPQPVPAPTRIETKVISGSGVPGLGGPSKLTRKMNRLARDGWRVVSTSGTPLLTTVVLERETNAPPRRPWYQRGLREHITGNP